jgi:hypothetical protein
MRECPILYTRGFIIYSFGALPGTLIVLTNLVVLKLDDNPALCTFLLFFGQIYSWQTAHLVSDLGTVTYQIDLRLNLGSSLPCLALPLLRLCSGPAQACSSSA